MYKKMPYYTRNMAFLRYNSMKRIVLYFITFIFSFVTYAADSTRVSLKGRVIDEKNEPVSLCLIKVEGQAASTTADLDGKYSISFNTADRKSVV